MDKREIFKQLLNRTDCSTDEADAWSDLLKEYPNSDFIENVIKIFEDFMVG